MPNSSSQTNIAAPSLIPPRTSSHGVAFPASSSPPKASPGHISQHRRSYPPAGFADPPQRRSSKRPTSSALENHPTHAKHGKKFSKVRAPGAGRPGLAQRYRLSVDYTEWVKQPAKPAGMTATDERAPQQPPESIGDDFIHCRQRPWLPEKEKILLAPYDYLFSQPGKDIRQQLISAFNEWLRVPEEKLKIITKVVGMLHTSSLLIDDVEDSSLLRRGEPVAHSIFGIPQVINSANYVYFLALQELSTLNNPACIHIFTEELLNLHRGQGMDLYWRDTLTCPSENDYLEMVSNKTGGLFRLAIKLMQAESTTIHGTSTPPTVDTEAPVNGSQPLNGADESRSSSNITCVPLINTIGLLFQILDDLLNLCSTTYHERKGHAEDLTEGKFSFPVIHAIRADPSNLVIINVLRQRTTDGEVKRYAVDYMERTGSFDYTKSVIAQLEKKAVRQVTWLEQRIGGDTGRSGGQLIRGILGKLKAL